MINTPLYNWFAATYDVGGASIAPVGWRLAINLEPHNLMTFIDPDGTRPNNDAGGHLREIGFEYWNSPNIGATNLTRFNARGAGYRDQNGIFTDLKEVFYFWSPSAWDGTIQKTVSVLSTQTVNFGVEGDGGAITMHKNSGIPIRLIKNSTTLTNGQEGTMIDIDGNVYQTICIGTQEWMAEDLRVRHYNNGVVIPIIFDNTEWSNDVNGAMSWYDNIISTTTISPTTSLITTTSGPTTTAFPWNRGITISHKLSTRVTSDDLIPYVIFSVNPGLGGCYEFTDLFISASYKPDSIVVALDRSFSDPVTIITSKIKTYNTGWYNVSKLPKTAGGNVLIGKVLFVKVIFPDHNYFYDLKIVRTGYREINGG